MDQDYLAKYPHASIVETAYGQMVLPSDHDMISQFLITYGEWAPYEHLIAHAFLKQGHTLIDAGAYLGTFSLACSTQKLNTIISIEANSKIVPYLAQNLKINCNNDYCIVQKAIGVESETAIIHPNLDNHGASYVTDVNEINVDQALSIQTTNLAEIREEHGDYQLMKLDIEGCELTALKQDQSYLHKKKPILLIEANEHPKTCQVANYCRWLGYAVAYVSTPVFRRDNFNRSSEALFALAHEGLLVAYPKPQGLFQLPKAFELGGGVVVPISNTTDLVRALWKTPRWATKSWVEMTKEQLIAVIGHYEQGELFADYQVRLTPDTPFGD